MLEGILKTTLLDCGSLKDADFLKAAKAGRVPALLEGLDPRLKLEQHNLIFDNIVPWLFWRSGWSGAGSPPSPYSTSHGAGPSPFGVIVITNLDSEPTYTEWSGEPNRYKVWHNSLWDSGLGNVDNSYGGWKNVVSEVIEPWQVWSATTGQEKISFRTRMLWLPSEIVSSEIKSFDIWFSSGATDADGYDVQKIRAGRIRFKDGNGTPVTITKTSAQVLLTEYTWSLISV